MLDFTFLLCGIVSFVLGWYSYELKYKLTNHSHQEGISIRTEVVSQETDLGVTPRPDDNINKESKECHKE